jgi:O-antigen/teichoic acid export membrane protein
MIKKIVSNSILFGLAPHLSKVAGIVILPYITPHLSLEKDYAIYGIILSYVAMISVFNQLGLNIILTNTFIQHPNHYKKSWQFIYGFLNVWMILFAFIQGIILYYLLPEHVENKFLTLFLISGPSILFGPVSIMANTYFVLTENSKPLFWRSVVFGNLAVVLNLFLIRNMELGYMGWFWTSFIIGVLTNASYWPYVNRKLKITPIYTYKPRLIKKYLRVSLPTIPHYYSYFLMESATVLIMEKVGVVQKKIGKYQTANQMYGQGNTFINAINTALNPRVMKLYRENDFESAKSLLLLYQYVTYIATFTAALWSKEIFEMLFKGDQYKGIYPLFIILIMALNYRPMYVASSNMFFYYQNTQRLWKITFLGGLIFAVGNYFLLQVYDIYASIILFYIVLNYIGFIGFTMKEYTKYSKIKFHSAQYIIYSILFLLISFYFVDEFWLNKLGIFLITLCCPLWRVIFHFRKIRNTF